MHLNPRNIQTSQFFFNFGIIQNFPQIIEIICSFLINKASKEGKFGVKESIHLGTNFLCRWREKNPVHKWNVWL